MCRCDYRKTRGAVTCLSPRANNPSHAFRYALCCFSEIKGSQVWSYFQTHPHAHTQTHTHTHVRVHTRTHTDTHTMVMEE